MSIVNPEMQSSEERPIGMRTRSDLIISESVFQGEKCWIVKDPLAMKYYRLQRAERLILQCLESDCSYHELKVLLNRTFPEKVTRLETLQQLVISLHQNGLLISPSTGQAMPLKKRRNKELRQKTIGLLSSLISMKFPGVDPERFLNRLYPLTRWFFTTWFFCIVCVTCLAASLLVLSNLEEFFSRLPDFRQFFAFDNILFMGFVMMFTKSIHELGHGLMCKHFGGECHEIGFMLLVMTPAMFCDTSDSWILPSRWRRMAIGAAGMYVEVFMAAICTFVWWFSNPGWIHYLALNIMFLSSVSTLVFNANPLLRYDGYYILSDFLEIPNLAQKSKMAMLSKLRVWFLGMNPVNTRLLPQQSQTIFAIYSIASFVYRWFVMLAIFWFLTEIFEPWGLSAIGHILIGISLTGMIVVPGYKLVKFFIYPGRIREVKRKRFLCSLFLFSAVVGFVCFFPLPHYVWVSFVIRPFESQQIVVTQPGILVDTAVRPGEMVEPGSLIAQLENDSLSLEIDILQGEIARLKSDLVAFRLTAFEFVDAASKIRETDEALRSKQNELETKRRQHERLTLVSTRSGVVIPPPNRAQQPIDRNRLPVWSGTALDPENKNSYLEENTLFCMIANPNHFQAVFLIEQSDVGLVQPGQKIIMLLQQDQTRFFTSTISFVSRNELEEVPRELSQTNGGAIAVMPNEKATESPVLTYFEANAELKMNLLRSNGIELMSGYFGTAKIRVGSASLGSRLVRYVRTIVNFR